MLTSTTMMTSAAAVIILLFILAKVLNLRSVADREKASPFECGFDPHSSARTPFSLRFFMLAIIFIVFDIEMVLLMPAPFLSSMSNSMDSMLVGMGFLTILLLGLIYEWKEGSLEWSS